MNDRTKVVIRILLTTAILLFLGFLCSQSVGLSAGGFDTASVLQQFNFYIVGVVFYIIAVILAFVELFIRKDDLKFGDSIAYTSQGEYPSLNFFKRFSSFQIFLLSTIIFSILGLFAVISKQTSLTAFATLQHQFTPVGSILYSALLIPISENGGAICVIAFSFFSFRMLARKYNWTPGTFRVLTLFFIPLLTAFYWFLNHLLRYSGSDVSLSVVFIFGFVGGLLTVLTGSCIPFLVMHQDNNLFFDLKNFYSNDIILIFSVVFIAIMIVSYFLLYSRKKKDKNNINNIYK
jgi:hypothetical protein